MPSRSAGSKNAGRRMGMSFSDERLSPFSVFTHGVPARVAKTRAFGNAIVPQVAQAFIEAYMSLS